MFSLQASRQQQTVSNDPRTPTKKLPYKQGPLPLPRARTAAELAATAPYTQKQTNTWGKKQNAVFDRYAKKTIFSHEISKVHPGGGGGSAYALSPRIRRASWMSLGMIVTRLA